MNTTTTVAQDGGRFFARCESCRLTIGAKYRTREGADRAAQKHTCEKHAPEVAR